MQLDQINILWPMMVAVLGFLFKDIYLTVRGDNKELINAVQTLTNEITRLNGHVEGLQREVDTLAGLRSELASAWTAIRVIEARIK
jgi:hypothetical protein